MKKLSRGQKAWATRKANAKKKSKQQVMAASQLDKASNWKVDSGKDLLKTQSLINKMYQQHEKSGIGKTLRIRFPADYITADGPTKILTLCEQLEETVNRLENRISNSIARINALIGQV